MTATKRTAIVQLHDIQIEARVGLYAHEKENRRRQRIAFDVAVSFAPGDDVQALANSVDYGRIYDFLMAYRSAEHIELIETLCDQVNAFVLQDAKVRTVKTTVRKLEIFADNPGYPSVSIEVSRDGS